MNVAVYKRRPESHTEDTHDPLLDMQYRICLLWTPRPSKVQWITQNRHPKVKIHPIHHLSTRANSGSKTSLLSMADFPSNTSVCSAPNDVFHYGYLLIACKYRLCRLQHLFTGMRP